jgi:ABC-2 type transport system ATP-binding protein
MSIEVTALTKRFRSKLAVDDLSFSVKPGVVTGFLGPNGAGKSTTMRMILGLDYPTKGQATVDGKNYAQIRRPLHHVGAVLEVGSVHGGRSAYNHLLCLAQSNGIGAKRVNEVMDLVGIEDVGKRRAGKFSLGMSQRLGVAAALLGDPSVLVCDEPVNGLDPEGILWIRTLLRSLAAEGRTIFVSSHLMSEMALTADHLVIIGQGRLIADSSTADIIARSSANHALVRSPRLRDLAAVLRNAGATVAEDSDADALRVTGLELAAIGDAAAASSIAIHELSPQSASLEEAFMDLTRDSVEFHAGVPSDINSTSGSVSHS